MNHDKRGFALLFLNEFKGTKDEIPSFNADKNYLIECFGHLGFTIVLLENKTKQQTIDELNKYAKKDHKNADCFLCVFASHGNETGFVSNDMQSIDLTSKILEIFSGKNSLVGKPKLFFINSCRGGKIMKEVIRLDTNSLYGRGPVSATPKSTPEICDILIYHSTIHKYASFTSKYGSEFIIELVNALNKYHAKFDLMKIIQRASDEISNKVFSYKNTLKNKQMFTIEPCCLRKNVYFRQSKCINKK